MGAARKAAILALICLSACAGQARQVSLHDDRSLSFNAMFPVITGQIRYRIYAETLTWMELLAEQPLPPDEYSDPDPGPGQTVPARRTFLLFQEDTYWYAAQGLFGGRNLTLQEVFDRGVTQAQIDAAVGSTHFDAITYKESSICLDPLRENAYPGSRDYRARGTVVLNVKVPSHPGNRWVLKVTSALAEEGFVSMQLPEGQHRIFVTDVEAGNTLVSLMAADSYGQSADTYFQEMYALVRKNDAAEIDMEFAGPSEAISPTSQSRYRIGYLGVGHNSQSDRANLPLQKGREAMVRVMVYDAWGDGGKVGNKTCKVSVEWSSPGGSGSKTFNSHISGYHVRSGRGFKKNEIDEAIGDNAAYDYADLGPTIPAAHVQPGLTVTAKLYAPPRNLLLATKTLGNIEVYEPRKIRIQGYDAHPRKGHRAEHVDDDKMTNWVMPYVNDVFPYSVATYNNRGKVWVPNFWGLIEGKNYLGEVVLIMNTLQGFHRTDRSASTEYLYLVSNCKSYANYSRAAPP
jgi:hypothetical protein